ncbi:XrtA/PEP-CTERM system TPR-repeat protein PrsT [Sedimenticola hydrogenitrophicus]|uniref:XrtA/PEP-CTERM system TPR-repeat protein PrsT n=1 Tax=Sedimenticola hydrogenitrophicus TaxID=2967975 RepID=UPI0021A2DD9A|nr:XrtA/PEP-CTERM system TPR-repeat protein PrsT [Sedimenticola hydrogenitrophicus]
MNKTIRRAFCLSSLLFIAGCGVVDDQQLVEKAKQHLSEGDSKSAFIELKNALQQNPENSAARTYLGRLYLDSGNFSAAEKELKKALELGADNNEVLFSLSQALLQMRKFDEVLSMQTDQLEPPEQGKLLATQGIAFLVKGEHEQAIELTTRALVLAPDSAYAQVARASTYLIAEKSLIKARQLLDRAFEIDKNFPVAWSLLGDIETNEKHLEAAREAYTKSISLQPTNLADRNKRVTLNILLNDLEKAQFDLDILRKQLPGNPAVAFSQGLVHLASNKLDDAKSSFDLAMLAQDRFPLSMFYLAYTNYQLGNVTQADIHAERYFAINPDYLPNRKLLAEIKFSQKEFADVEKLLSPLVKANIADDAVLHILAKTKLIKGETAEGLALLNQIVEQNPESAEARLLLGTGLWMSGNQEGAFAQIETAIKLDTDYHQADIYRVLGYLKLKQMAKAHQSAAEFQARAPDSEIPYNLIGMIYLAEREFNSARQALERSWNIKPGNTDAGHNLASIAVREGKYERARGYLDGVLKAHPENLETLLKLSELDAAEGKTEQQVQRLERAIRLYPSTVGPRLLLARHYISSGNPGQVTGLIATLDSESRNQLPVMEVVASQAIAQERYLVAEKIAKDIITRNPDAPVGYYLLAQAHTGMGNMELVEEDLRKSIRQNDRLLPARIALLRMLVNRQDIPAIEREIASLKEFAAENEDVMKVEFALEERKGNQQQALKLAENLFSAYPNTDNMLALSRQKLRVGDSAGALVIQMDWAEKHSGDYKANLILAETYTRLNKDELAVKYYQRALTVSPDDVLALNNLAWSLRNTAPDQALQHAQKANRLKSASVTLMDTLAMVYLANKEYELALRTIKDVRYLEPENPTLRYHEAIINATAGNSKLALQLLGELLSKQQDFSEKSDAEALFEKLKSG